MRTYGRNPGPIRGGTSVRRRAPRRVEQGAAHAIGRAYELRTPRRVKSDPDETDDQAGKTR